jgi:type I restriction enzyme S subunit
MNTVAGVGGSLIRARPQFVKSIEAPVPSPEQQKRIALILDEADSIRAKRRRVVGRFDILTQSIFHEMFGDPPSWPARWDMTTIGDLAVSVDYGTSAKSGSTGVYPVLRMGNLTDDGRLDLSDLKYMDLEAEDFDRYTVKVGDMLFNRTNSFEKVGKAAVVRGVGNLAYAGYLIRVRFRAASYAEFVSAYLRSPHGKATRRRLAKAAVNQANISAKQMRTIPVADPPVKLIGEFAERLALIERRRAEVEEMSKFDDELFTSLQSRAFKGEL